MRLLVPLDPRHLTPPSSNSGRRFPSGVFFNLDGAVIDVDQDYLRGSRLEASIASRSITRERARCSAWMESRGCSPTDDAFPTGSKLDGVQRYVDRHKRIFAKRGHVPTSDIVEQ